MNNERTLTSTHNGNVDVAKEMLTNEIAKLLADNTERRGHLTTVPVEVLAMVDRLSHIHWLLNQS
jgi:hypothetical protein